MMYPVGDRHLISARQLTKSSLSDFFDRSQEYIDLLADRELANNLSESMAKELFFCGRIRPLLGFIATEPTTRTRMSFEAAMYRLGGDVILMNGIKLQQKKRNPGRIRPEWFPVIRTRWWFDIRTEKLSCRPWQFRVCL